MKRLTRPTLATLLALTATLAGAQNVQLHYDLGHALYPELSARPNVTTTVEMFKPDRWGSTFLFADFDYFHDGSAGAYWEISREVNLCPQSPFAVHAEYNGGMTSIEHTAIASRFQHALLGGLAWNTASADFSRTFSLQALYKYYFAGMGRGAFSGFQLTGVWSWTFGRQGLCTFSGYVDVWYDPDVDGKLIVMSEPQFWFNLGTTRFLRDVPLSVGTEVEVSNNFVYDDEGHRNTLYFIPTVAAKWTF